MPTTITTKKACKTPFSGNGNWEWNYSPVGGTPPRERCQSVASEDERQAAVKLIQAYRSAEKVSADNNIEVRQQELGRPFGAPKGVGAELLKREIAQCDHNAFVAAAEELAKLRSDAVELIKLI